MLKCPNCGCEYREGFTTCSDCKCDLIEVPDAPKDDVKNSTIMQTCFSVILFLLGLIFIFNSPIIAHKLSYRYFFPGGSGSCNPEDLIAMTQAYNYSLLLIGFLICLPCILYWYKMLHK